MRTWRLDDGRQSLLLAAEGDRLPQVVHFGAPLGDDADVIAATQTIDVTGGMLDATPPLSICPEAIRTFPGQPGMILRWTDGTPLMPRLKFAGEDTTPTSLVLKYADADLGLGYAAHFEIDPDTHVLTLWSEIDAEQPLHLHWLAAPVLPAAPHSSEMIDVAGRWIGEFQLNRTPWSAGIRYRENRTGRTGHEHFPGLILTTPGTTNTQGEAWGFHYGWSGGHRMIAEELPDGRRQVQFGHAARTERDPQTHFRTAPLYVTHSMTGLNGVGTAFQRHLRDRIVPWPDRQRQRPVHYNCWEAIYFDHSLDKLREIADRAAALGAERFVLDDGWFGQRDDDTSSLADWEVDPRKYPDGLDPLIRHIHDLGMTFGIWFEPEMVNRNSRVFRAHPDWALGAEDQVLGRHQMALDMSREDVRDYLFERLSAIIGGHAIDYVKWDHNRVLPAPDAAQTRGVYALFDRLREAFPKLEIESCASGGGRIDFGILKRTHRVWLSDSNDAHERLRMQHDAALFLPSVVTGSHVGPRRSHTSGRILDIRFRAWVAAQRHMGFEMDPRELTEDEAQVLARVTVWWKENRDWMGAADILRLDAADPAILAEQQQARDGARFVVFAGRRESSAQIANRPLRLTALDPAARYRVTLLNAADATSASRGPVALKDGPVTLSGAALMGAGLQLPISYPDSIWVLQGERLTEGTTT